MNSSNATRRSGSRSTATKRFGSAHSAKSAVLPPSAMPSSSQLPPENSSQIDRYTSIRCGGFAMQKRSAVDCAEYLLTNSTPSTVKVSPPKMSSMASLLNAS